MPTGGSTGPNAGGYFILSFATQTLPVAGAQAGYTLGAFTVPTGSRLGIVAAQAFTETSGTTGQASAMGRANVLIGGTSILSSAEIPFASGSAAQGTLSAGTAVATSGQTVTATAIGGVSQTATHVVVSMLCFLMEHPDSIFGNFGYAEPASQPAFGPSP